MESFTVLSGCASRGTTALPQEVHILNLRGADQEPGQLQREVGKYTYSPFSIKTFLFHLGFHKAAHVRTYWVRGQTCYGERSSKNRFLSKLGSSQYPHPSILTAWFPGSPLHLMSWRMFFKISSFKYGCEINKNNAVPFTWWRSYWACGSSGNVKCSGCVKFRVLSPAQQNEPRTLSSVFICPNEPIASPGLIRGNGNCYKDDSISHLYWKLQQ